MEDWKLTDEEYNQLSESDKAKYNKACVFKNDDWAEGPYGGWVRGNNLLIELGWKEITIESGHREFVSLVKPSKQI